MSKEINLHFVFDKKFFLDTTKKVYEYELKHSPKKYIGWFFIALAQFGVVGALKHNAYGLLFISTIFLFYWYILRWQVRKYFALKWFEKIAIKNKAIDVKIDSNGITSNLYDKKLSYKDIALYKVTQDGVLLFHDGVASFFPKEIFKNVEDYDDFLKILKEKVSTSL
jgi:Zn-dependent protease with chaperone function